MQIFGGSERDVDRVVWVDDLNVKTLIGLIERIEQTSEMEQRIFREAELDDAYRQADADVRLAQRDGTDSATLAELQRVRGIIFSAHDLVGLGQMPEAVLELNKVVDIKIGLDKAGNYGNSP